MKIGGILIKYIFLEHFRTIFFVKIFFISSFALIDFVTNSEKGFFYSILGSISALDPLFAFIALIATIICILKFKQKSEDVGFLSIGLNPERIFFIFTASSLICYGVLMFLLHPIAFELLKRKDRNYSGNNCIFESSGKIIENNTLKVSKIIYDMCSTPPSSLEEIEFTKNLREFDSQKNDYVLIGNEAKSLKHIFADNSIKEIFREKQSSLLIERLRRIDQYKKDIRRGQISIYHIIYLGLKDSTGIVSFVDLIDVLLFKIKNVMLVILFVNIVYFLSSCNKRSGMIPIMTIKIISATIVYYILSYIACEKVIYSDSFLTKLFTFCIFHCCVYFILRYFQHIGLISFGGILKKLRKALQIKKN